MVSFIIYLVLVVLGIFFQNMLHGGLRLIIYPLSFIIGLVTGYQFNYYTLSFNVGMIFRAASGGYWFCVLVESICFVSGLLIGFCLFPAR